MLQRRKRRGRRTRGSDSAGRSGRRTAFRRAGGFSVVGDDDCGKMARPEVREHGTEVSARAVSASSERGA